MVVARPGGTLHGEGHGIVMAKDGKIATWIGQGVGTMKKDGTVSYRGAVCYQTSSPRCWRTRIRAYRSNDYTSKREIDIEMTRMMSRA